MESRKCNKSWEDGLALRSNRKVRAQSLDIGLSELSALYLAGIGLRPPLFSSLPSSSLLPFFLLEVGTEPQAFPAIAALDHWTHQPLFYILFWGSVSWGVEADLEIILSPRLLWNLPFSCLRGHVIASSWDYKAVSLDLGVGQVFMCSLSLLPHFENCR